MKEILAMNCVKYLYVKHFIHLLILMVTFTSTLSETTDKVRLKEYETATNNAKRELNDMKTSLGLHVYQNTLKEHKTPEELFKYIGNEDNRKRHSEANSSDADTNESHVADNDLSLKIQVNDVTNKNKESNRQMHRQPGKNIGKSVTDILSQVNALDDELKSIKKNQKKKKPSSTKSALLNKGGITNNDKEIAIGEYTSNNGISSNSGISNNGDSDIKSIKNNVGFDLNLDMEGRTAGKQNIDNLYGTNRPDYLHLKDNNILEHDDNNGYKNENSPLNIALIEIRKQLPLHNEHNENHIESLNGKFKDNLNTFESPYENDNNNKPESFTIEPINRQSDLVSFNTHLYGPSYYMKSDGNTNEFTKNQKNNKDEYDLDYNRSLYENSLIKPETINAYNYLHKSHMHFDLATTTERPFGVEDKDEVEESLRPFKYPIGILRENYTDDITPTKTKLVDKLATGDDGAISRLMFDQQISRLYMPLNDQLETDKNNLSHEANYKLSKVEQDASEAKKDFINKWGALNDAKRSSIKRKRFNAIEEIKLKTSSRLMSKGFGPSLPSNALADTRKESLIEAIIKRKDQEINGDTKKYNGEYEYDDMERNPGHYSFYMTSMYPYINLYDPSVPINSNNICNLREKRVVTNAADNVEVDINDETTNHDNDDRISNTKKMRKDVSHKKRKNSKKVKSAFNERKHEHQKQHSAKKMAQKMESKRKEKKKIKRKKLNKLSRAGVRSKIGRHRKQNLSRQDRKNIIDNDIENALDRDIAKRTEEGKENHKMKKSESIQKKSTKDAKLEDFRNKRYKQLVQNNRHKKSTNDIKAVNYNYLMPAQNDEDRPEFKVYDVVEIPTLSPQELKHNLQKMDRFISEVVNKNHEAALEANQHNSNINHLKNEEDRKRRKRSTELIKDMQIEETTPNSCESIENKENNITSLDNCLIGEEYFFLTSYADNIISNPDFYTFKVYKAEITDRKRMKRSSQIPQHPISLRVSPEYAYNASPYVYYRRSCAGRPKHKTDGIYTEEDQKFITMNNNNNNFDIEGAQKSFGHKIFDNMKQKDPKFLKFNGITFDNMWRNSVKGIGASKAKQFMQDNISSKPYETKHNRNVNNFNYDSINANIEPWFLFKSADDSYNYGAKPDFNNYWLRLGRNQKDQDPMYSKSKNLQRHIVARTANNNYSYNNYKFNKNPFNWNEKYESPFLVKPDASMALSPLSVSAPATGSSALRSAPSTSAKSSASDSPPWFGTAPHHSDSLTVELSNFTSYNNNPQIKLNISYGRQPLAKHGLNTNFDADGAVCDTTTIQAEQTTISTIAPETVTMSTSTECVAQNTSTATATNIEATSTTTPNNTIKPETSTTSSNVVVGNSDETTVVTGLNETTTTATPPSSVSTSTVEGEVEGGCKTSTTEVPQTSTNSEYVVGENCETDTTTAQAVTESTNCTTNTEKTTEASLETTETATTTTDTCTESESESKSESESESTEAPASESTVENCSTITESPTELTSTESDDQVKLNITINANVMGSPKNKNFFGNGTINVMPGYTEDRARRGVSYTPFDVLTKNKCHQREHNCDGKGDDTDDDANTDNETTSNEFDDVASGKLSTEVVNSVFTTIKNNPKLKFLWPSLKHLQQNCNKQSTEALYALKNQHNDEQVKRSEILLKKAIDAINNIIEEQVRSRTCVPLRPDLQEFYDEILNILNKHDNCEKRAKREYVMGNMSEALYALKPNEIEENLHIVQKLLQQYYQLPSSDQKEMSYIYNALLKDLIFLRQITENQNRRRRQALEQNELGLEVSNDDAIKRLSSLYTTQYLKLLKTADLYREMCDNDYEANV